MTQASHTAGARVLIVAVAALLLGACSSTSASGTAAPSTTSTPTATAPPSATTSGTSVDVTEKEFSITLSQTTFQPGTYTFTIKNQGSFPHNLTIEGPGVDKKGSPTIAGGQSSSLTVPLQAGSYELWCAVPGHKDRGMDMRIKVS